MLWKTSSMKSSSYGGESVCFMTGQGNKTYHLWGNDRRICAAQRLDEGLLDEVKVLKVRLLLCYDFVDDPVPM